MNLYATTTSERASKGQGGHKHLKIILQAEMNDKTKPVIATLTLTNDKAGDQYLLNFEPQKNLQEYEKEGKKSVVIETKNRRWCISKQAETRTKYCKDCGEKTFGTGWEDGLCDTCWEKKQPCPICQTTSKDHRPYCRYEEDKQKNKLRPYCNICGETRHIKNDECTKCQSTDIGYTD